MSEIPDSFGALNATSITFAAFSKTYLEFVDQLVERHVSREQACQIAMDLSVNYLNFLNNSKFAEVGNIAFVPEEDM